MQNEKIKLHLINQRQSLQKWQNREETSQRNICLWAAVGHRLITICVWDAQMSMRPATDHFLSITAQQHSTEQLISFIRTGNMSSSSSCSHTCMYMVYEELFLMSTTYILSLSWQLFFNIINYCISLYISGGFHSSRLADRWTFVFLPFLLLRNGNLTRIWTLLTRDVIEKLCDLRYLFQF